MRRYLQPVFIILVLCFGIHASAQDAPFRGMNYQGIARSADGSVLTNQPLLVRLAFSDREEDRQTYYSELHRVTTDELGLFRLIIGRGEPTLENDFSAIPWASKNIWLDLEISSNGPQDFVLVGSTELLTVPYAFYAESTGALVDDDEVDLRSATPGPSILWTTSGNGFTRPPFHFLGNRDNQALVVKTNNERRLVITADGQTRLLYNNSGNEGNYNAYALTIQNSRQGIYIKVNGGRSGETNFMTFADGGPGEGPGMKWGEIEGQTLGELLSSFDYLFRNAIFVIDGIKLAATAIGNGAEAAGEAAAGGASIATIIFAWAAPGWFTAAGADIAKSIILAADAIALAAQAIEFNINAIASVGVTYSSGAGDYAEWLLRTPGEPDMAYGEVVGVHAGKVSRITEGADHYMVVSLRPAVLGNAPIQNREHLYEKIAFMGQVPVRVVGAVEVGDYILPSGKNDGLGMAVSPGELPAGEHHKIVGIAWESAPARPLNTVTIGVGLHRNKLADDVQHIEDKVDRIMTYLTGEGPLHPASDEQLTVASLDDIAPLTTAEANNVLSEEAFEAFLKQEADHIEETFRLVGVALRQKGYDLEKENPQLARIIDDPLTAIRELRKDDSYRAYWQPVEEKIKALQQQN